MRSGHPSRFRRYAETCNLRPGVFERYLCIHALAVVDGKGTKDEDLKDMLLFFKRFQKVNAAAVDRLIAQETDWWTNPDIYITLVRPLLDERSMSRPLMAREIREIFQQYWSVVTSIVNDNDGTKSDLCLDLAAKLGTSLDMAM